MPGEKRIDLGGDVYAPVTILVDGAGNPISIAGNPTAGPVTDRSGTITSGGQAQQLAPANAARKYLYVRNVGINNIYIDFGVSAVQGQPSIPLVPGEWWESAIAFVPSGSISVIGPVTGQSFTAKEG